MILLIDNYDSFVHNLARYVGELGQERCVYRNDELSVADALALDPSAIILSPGPGHPTEAGLCIDLVKNLPANMPLLGVCLGHQAIGEAFGGATRQTGKPVHGKASAIRHDGTGLFKGLPNPFSAARYHSLITELAPNGDLIATAWSQDDTLMAIAHRHRPIYGVQFHPESILTPGGHGLLANFLSLAGLPVTPHLPHELQNELQNELQGERQSELQ